jgi:hypothetical protein
MNRMTKTVLSALVLVAILGQAPAQFLPLGSTPAFAQCGPNCQKRCNFQKSCIDEWANVRRAQGLAQAKKLMRQASSSAETASRAIIPTIPSAVLEDMYDVRVSPSHRLQGAGFRLA